MAGSLEEARYEWPKEGEDNKTMTLQEVNTPKIDDVVYING